MSRMNIYRVGKFMGLISDIIAVTLVFLLTDLVFPRTTYTLPVYLIFVCIIMAVQIILDTYADFYSYTTQNKRLPVTIAVAMAMSVCVSLPVIALTGNASLLSPIEYFFFYFLSYASIISGRKLVFTLLIKARKKQSMLIIYAKDCPEEFLNRLKRNAIDYGSIRLVEISEDNAEEIEDDIDKSDNLLILSNVPERLRDKYILYSFSKGKSVKIIPTVENLALTGGRITHIGDTPIIGLNNDTHFSATGLIKRAFDIAASLLGLIITSPVFLIIAAAIKLDSPGSVFYFQERYTIHKKRFNIIKFRTMVKDAEKMGAKLATERDDRITRTGRILRSCRLDELPQLINILKGEMSFVGPRPERPIYADRYSVMVKNYDIRYTVKAGLTGYAQIYGQYNTKVSDKVLFDSIYINNFSLWLDLKLIMQTALIMFVRESTEGVNENMASVPNAAKSEKSKAGKL